MTLLLQLRLSTGLLGTLALEISFLVPIKAKDVCEPVFVLTRQVGIISGPPEVRMRLEKSTRSQHFSISYRVYEILEAQVKCRISHFDA